MWLCLLGFLLIIRGILTENSLLTDSEYPRPNSCISKLMQCNEQKIQISPFKVNGVVIFTRYSDLEKSCSYGKNFFKCMQDAEIICKDFPIISDRIFQNRQFAERLCSKDNIWKKWYIESSYCINYFSFYVLDHCAMVAIKNISEEYERGTPAFTCRFHVEMRSCRTSTTRNYCGLLAGEILEKVLLYHRDYDLFCAYFDGYDSNIKTSTVSDTFTTTDGIINHEFENTNLHRMGYNVNYETSTSTPENISTATAPDDIQTDQSDPEIQKNEFFTTESFYKNIDSLFSVDNLGWLYVKFQKSHLAEKFSTFERNFDSFAQENETSFQNDERVAFDSSKKSHYVIKSYDYLSTISEENYSNDFATFGLYEILDQGTRYYLGCGFAMISRTENYPLKNMYCTWASNTDPEQMFKCSVHITEACLFEEKCDGPSCDVLDLAYETSLLIYVLDNEIYQNKATIKLKYYKPNTNALPPGKISLHAHHPGSDKFDADYRQWKFSVTPNY